MQVAAFHWPLLWGSNLDLSAAVLCYDIISLNYSPASVLA